MALPLHLQSFLMMSTCKLYPMCMLLTVAVSFKVSLYYVSLAQALKLMGLRDYFG